MDRLLTAEKASAYLCLHPETLYKMGRMGQIPVVRLKRGVRFDVKDLDAWIETKKKLANENAIRP